MGPVLLGEERSSLWRPTVQLIWILNAGLVHSNCRAIPPVLFLLILCLRRENTEGGPF